MQEGKMQGKWISNNRKCKASGGGPPLEKGLSHVPYHTNEERGVWVFMPSQPTSRKVGQKKKERHPHDLKRGNMSQHNYIHHMETSKELHIAFIHHTHKQAKSYTIFLLRTREWGDSKEKKRKKNKGKNNTWIVWSYVNLEPKESINHELQSAPRLCKANATYCTHAPKINLGKLLVWLWCDAS